MERDGYKNQESERYSQMASGTDVRQQLVISRLYMEQLEQSLTICLAAFERCRSPGEVSQIGGGRRRRSKPPEQREKVETEAGLLRERVI